MSMIFVWLNHRKWSSDGIMRPNPRRVSNNRTLQGHPWKPILTIQIHLIKVSLLWRAWPGNSYCTVDGAVRWDLMVLGFPRFILERRIKKQLPWLYSPRQYIFPFSVFTSLTNQVEIFRPCHHGLYLRDSSGRSRNLPFNGWLRYRCPYSPGGCTSAERLPFLAKGLEDSPSPIISVSQRLSKEVQG